MLYKVRPLVSRTGTDNNFTLLNDETRNNIGGLTMGLLDLNKAIAPVQEKIARQDCESYESIYDYFVERVQEMDTDDEIRDEEESWPWVQYDNRNDSWYCSVLIATEKVAMPLYWKTEHVKPAQVIEIKNPDMSIRTTRNKILGYTRYLVDSKEAGKDLLLALAKEEDEDFKKILTFAADAIADVKNIEQPHKNERAEMLYAEWFANNPDSPLGDWSHKDAIGKSGVPTFSKDKTNKKNQYKQTAARQLGYERAKVVIELR